MNTAPDPLKIASCLLEGFNFAYNKSGKTFNKSAAVEGLKKIYSENYPESELPKKVDEFLTAFPECSELSEYLFDIGLVKLISAGTEKEGEAFFDSDAWMKLEDETIDRGTELLNVLVYLNDCIESEVKPSLDDFLNEFLLVDEDEFQDEYEIYEPFIRNSELAVSGSIEEIFETAKKVDDPITADLFLPLMIYFRFGANEKILNEIATRSGNPESDCAVFGTLMAF